MYTLICHIMSYIVFFSSFISSKYEFSLVNLICQNMPSFLCEHRRSSRLRGAGGAQAVVRPHGVAGLRRLRCPGGLVFARPGETDGAGRQGSGGGALGLWGFELDFWWLLDSERVNVIKDLWLETNPPQMVKCQPFGNCKVSTWSLGVPCGRCCCLPCVGTSSA